MANINMNISDAANRVVVNFVATNAFDGTLELWIGSQAVQMTPRQFDAIARAHEYLTKVTQAEVASL